VDRVARSRIQRGELAAEQRTGTVREHAAPRGRVERGARRAEVAGDLPDEERVTAGQLDRGIDYLVIRSAAGDRPDQRADLDRAEPRELDGDRGSRQRGRELGSGDADDGDRQPVELADEELEQRA